MKFETADEKRERVKKADAEYPKAAMALSQMLLGPVAGQLRQKRLLVVPDGALEYIPFAALTVPMVGPQNIRRLTSFVPLMVQHEVTSIPSASTLAVLRRELQGRAQAEKVVAVLADSVFDKTDERFTGHVESRRTSPGSSSECRRDREFGGARPDAIFGRWSRFAATSLHETRGGKRFSPLCLQPLERLRSALTQIVRLRRARI